MGILSRLRKSPEACGQISTEQEFNLDDHIPPEKEIFIDMVLESFGFVPQNTGGQAAAIRKVSGAMIVQKEYSEFGTQTEEAIVSARKELGFMKMPNGRSKEGVPLEYKRGIAMVNEDVADRAMGRIRELIDAFYVSSQPTITTETVSPMPAQQIAQESEPRTAVVA